MNSPLFSTASLSCLRPPRPKCNYPAMSPTLDSAAKPWTHPSLAGSQSSRTYPLPSGMLVYDSRHLTYSAC